MFRVNAPLNFRVAANFSDNSENAQSRSSPLPINESPVFADHLQMTPSLDERTNSDISTENSEPSGNPGRRHKHKLTKARAAALSVFQRGFVVSV